MNIVKDEKGDLVTDCHSILARWRKYFSQLLNVHGVNDVRQTEMHTDEPLVPEPTAFEDEMACEKLKRHKSLGIIHILAKLINVAGRKFCSEIHNLLILFRRKRYCLKSGRSRKLYLFIIKVIKQTVVITEAYQFVNYIQNCIQHPAVKVNSICRGNYLVSSMWNSPQQVNYYSHNLHMSNT
jgi:hypothetical protein